ncbi:DUF7344 domain-containing protein [Halovivax gelatinilyticus]|uniref:DUF7344 domain-containing protein n=1 Tax=Halovivax gelatinilyticus TaxID=2961597 RepID=UPI0020CA875F|nr:hypothetical protein [Halovivax gelatinilyticus]
MTAAASASVRTGDLRDRSPSLSQDTAFKLLSCPRRRYVIHLLKQGDGPIELRDLVTHVAAWENDVSVDETTYEQRMRVYTALRQSHLPKLDDGGVVEFNADRGVVEPTDATSQLDVYLDVVPHDDIPWSTYYAGLGALCLWFTAGVWFGLLPFSLVSPTLGMLVVTVLFSASALAHVRYERRRRLGADGRPPANGRGER